MRNHLIALALVFLIVAPVPAQTVAASEWMARYTRALALDPANTFYQYAVATTAKRLDAPAPSTPSRAPRTGQWEGQIYEMTTGAAAVQESLQLDRSAGAGDTVSPATVPVASIEGVATPSVPFEKLMNGRTPAIEPLAKAAPADWYYMHFPRVVSMRRVLAAADRWGSHLLAAYTVTGRDARVRDRIERQTLLRASPELDPFYDLVVGDVAVVGSDPFLAEGSDVTFIFTVKNQLLFTTRLELERRNAVAASSNVSISHETYRTWTVDGVANADRSLSSYATVRDGVAIIGNSYAALRQVADVVDGLAPSMAASPDFQYMRAVKPYADRDEDGFLFLSDAFVRRMVGPEVKIGEARRVRCAVSLQTIGYASIMFRAEQGRAPTSTDELVEARYVDVPSMRCPDGGTYSLVNGIPVCSAHNRLPFLKPNLEIAIDRVAPEEAEAYGRFRENYKTYWRRYLDPVGIRIRTGDALEVEATILPLVQNSIYSEAIEVLGADPVSLSRPQLPDAVATFDVKMPGGSQDSRDFLKQIGRSIGVDGEKLFARALGDRVSVQIADARPTIGTDLAGALGGLGRGFDDWLVLSPVVASLTLPTAVVFPIRDRTALDESLAELRAYLAGGSASWDNWVRVGGYRLVQGGSRTIEAATVRLLVFEWRVFYAVVGDRFVVATDRDMIDKLASAPLTGDDRGAMRFEIAPSRWKQIAPSLALAYAEDSREVCLANVSWLEALRAAYPKAPHELDAEALGLFGATFACPDNGRYVAGSDGRVACAQHGTREAPRQGPRPQPGSPAAYMLESVRRIEATLAFTPDGLTTKVRIE